MSMSVSDFLSLYSVDRERVEEHKARMLLDITEHENSTSTQNES